MGRFIWFAGLLFFHTASWAWSDLGHEVAAQIAWSRLDAATQKKIQKLLMVTARYDKQNRNFVRASVWADDIRQSLPVFGQWHYIDLPIVVEPLREAPKPNSDNLVSALCNASYTLIHNKSEFASGLMLPILIHLVTDAHQPLHTVSRYSVGLPQGDRGGVLYPITVGITTTNLHLYWDLGLGLLGDVAKPKSSKRHDLKKSRELALAWSKAYPPKHFGNEVQNTNFQEWANKGLELARQTVYDTPEKQTPSDAYVEKGQAIVKAQIVLAGYRLAYLLSQLFDRRVQTKTKLWEQSCF
jgi:hypothetical protein